MMHVMVCDCLCAGQLLAKLLVGWAGTGIPKGIKASAAVTELLSKLLEPDPEVRWTASQAMKHPWLAGWEPESADMPDTPLSPPCKVTVVEQPPAPEPEGGSRAAAGGEDADLPSFVRGAGFGPLSVSIPVSPAR